MKRTLLLLSLFLLFSLAASAQAPRVGKTALKECVNEERPRDCTLNKLKADIAGLITPEITTALRSKGVGSFTITSALIIDEHGKVIPGQLEVRCDHETIKQKVVNYYNNLPDFAIAENIHLATEKRALYLAQYIFLFDNVKSRYVLAEKEQLKGYKTADLPELIGTPPHSKDCSDSSNPTLCSTDEFLKFFKQKMAIPKDTKEGKYKFRLDFGISESGKIKLINIDDPTGKFESEVRRVAAEHPDFIPASIHGIYYGAKFTLPLTINVKN
jgi:hypothetical protein